MTPHSRTGRCPGCDFDWDGPAAELLPLIADTGRRFRDAIDPGSGPHSDVTRLRVRPADGSWSAIEYLAHVSDVVSFFDERIDRIINEDRPVFEPRMRFADRAEASSYRTLDVDEVLAALDDRVRRARDRLATVDDSAWHRCGIGTDGDERTVADLTRRLAHESQHHLGDLARVLAG